MEEKRLQDNPPGYSESQGYPPGPPGPGQPAPGYPPQGQYVYPQPGPNPPGQYPNTGYGQPGQPPAAGYPPSSYQGQNVTVVNQPAPVTNVVVTNVDNHMGLAFFACLCCFWPLGLYAIYLSCKVGTALERHDIGDAQRLSEESRKFSKIAIIIGVVIIVVSITINVILAIAAASAASSDDY